MNLLIVMVGLQGSGKSTKAKELAKEINAEVLSSDEIRKSNPSWDNGKVFEYLYKQMNDYLLECKNVIIDATNTTLKSRRAIFENLKYRDNLQIHAWVMNTEYEVCLDRVMKRNENKDEHFVPLHVVTRYRDNFEIPVIGEGFDDVIMNKYNEFDSDEHYRILKQMVNFDQKNHHHTMDLFMHSYTAGEEFGSIEQGLFHDIGKLFCQTFDDKGEAHYYNHANIGAYYLLSHTEIVRFSQFEMITAIANYHMKVYDWKQQKTHEKYKKLLGEDLYKKLIKFHEADEGAH